MTTTPDPVTMTMMSATDALQTCTEACAGWQQEIERFVNLRLAEEQPAAGEALMTARDIPGVIKGQQEWALQATTDYTQRGRQAHTSADHTFVDGHDAGRPGRRDARCLTAPLKGARHARKGCHDPRRHLHQRQGIGVRRRRAAARLGRERCAGRRRQGRHRRHRQRGRSHPARAEIDTTAKKSWLARLLDSEASAAHDFVAANTRRVSDVMTAKVVTATEDATLGELVELMERHGIKRIPIVRGRILAGVVSRSDLLRALLSREPHRPVLQPTDKALRQAVVEALEHRPWTSKWPTNVFANDGVVHLWGFVDGEEVRKAYRVAAENVPGVRRVKDHLRALPPSVGMGVCNWSSARNLNRARFHLIAFRSVHGPGSAPPSATLSCKTNEGAAARQALSSSR